MGYIIENSGRTEFWRGTRTKGIPYRLLVPMATVLRARALVETRGFQKALVATDSDRILGFMNFGVGAGEVMSAVQIAMMGGLPYIALRDAVLAHPTLVEGLHMLFASPLLYQVQRHRRIMAV